SPDGATVYVKDNRGLVVIDAKTWKVEQELAAKGGTSMHGIAVLADGSAVYLTTSKSELLVAQRGADGKFAWTKTIGMPGVPLRPCFPCGLAIAYPGPMDGERAPIAYVCLSRSN